MKNITPKELPEVLNSETLEKLIFMLHNFSEINMDDWTEIVKILRKRNQLEMVLNQYEESIVKSEREDKKNKTEEELHKEEIELENFNNKKRKFYGNMGEPTTPKEYRNKYGVWPPDYDGNKLEND
jgi:hypothetical protein